MATIEKRVRNGRTTYRVRYRDPAGRQRSKVFARKADAQRFLNETETAKVRGAWTDPALGRVLFRDWLGEWWATTTNLRPKTRDRDELLLRRLALPSFGAVPLAVIGQRDVRAWVAELSARGLAPATVQKAYQLLGKVMGAAVDAGMLAQSPCRRVPLPKVEREEMRFLTPAEVAALVEAIQLWTSPRWPDTVAMRPGSMVAGGPVGAGVPSRRAAGSRWWNAADGGCTRRSSGRSRLVPRRGCGSGSGRPTRP
jgi:hypothetical protein